MLNFTFSYSISYYRKYEISNFQMSDIIMPPGYFKSFLPELEKEELSSKCYYEQRANLSLENCVRLKKAGVDKIQVGIETFSNKLLKQINKGTDVSQNITCLRYSLSLGISVFWNLMWGFPDEKEDEYKKMISLLPLLVHLQPPTGLFHLYIVKFSEYYKEAKPLATVPVELLKAHEIK